MSHAVRAAIDNYDTKGDNTIEKEVANFRHLLKDDVTISILSTETKIMCDACDQEASIFQAEGNFCLDCWQNRTEPHIT
jgi:hypothetical protein